MSMAKPLIRMPKEAKRGEVIEIKTLIEHRMESGFRRDNVGGVVPRDIINAFVCRYAGEEIFRADLHPGTAANPYIAFHTVATESGDMVFQWTDDRGQVTTETVKLTVS
jgi:sulfur-oxidizing protein SoxZ